MIVSILHNAILPLDSSYYWIEISLRGLRFTHLRDKSSGSPITYSSRVSNFP